MSRPSRAGASRRGLTLIELLVAVAIIGVLIALLVPAVQASRQAMNRIACLNNLKQIGIALHGYHATHDRFPPGYGSRTLRDDPLLASISGGWAWGASILGGLEQTSLYNAINFSHSMDDSASSTSLQASPGVFLCPSNADRGPARARGEGAVFFNLGPSQYLASTGLLDPEEFPDANNGVFFHNKSVGLRDISDGSSTTLAVGEESKNLADAAWAGAVPGHLVCRNPSWRPGRRPCEPSSALVLGMAVPPGHDDGRPVLNAPDAHPGNFASMHPGGVNFLLADGSTRFIRETISDATMAALATRAGAEVVGDF